MKHESMKNLRYMIPALAATLCMGTALAAGDGSDEAGFVAPPEGRTPPPAPPRSIASAESVFGCCCCCPSSPQARTEAKKPPQPPALITKLKSE